MQIQFNVAGENESFLLGFATMDGVREEDNVELFIFSIGIIFFSLDFVFEL